MDTAECAGMSFTAETFAGIAHEFRNKSGVAGTVEYGLFATEGAAVAGVLARKCCVIDLRWGLGG